jgi:hypothetical protein
MRPKCGLEGELSTAMSSLSLKIDASIEPPGAWFVTTRAGLSDELHVVPPSTDFHTWSSEAGVVVK